MDREIPVPNRYIDQKMQELKQKKHRQTLYNIKTKHRTTLNPNYFNASSQSPLGKLSRQSCTQIQNKNLEIEKQNIKLFNKIANIIREKPKNVPARSFAISLVESKQRHRKTQERMKTENQIFLKRLSNQKSTIQNKLFYKDRRQNLKYLKFIGRYPYEQTTKRYQTQQAGGQQKQQAEISSHSSMSKMFSVKSMRDNSTLGETEVFCKKNKDSLVRIVNVSNTYYLFILRIEGREKPYKYTMPRNTYEQQMEKCGNNFQKLISKLRLTQGETVIFQYS